MADDRSRKGLGRGKVFVSYRREGGAEMARLIRDSLTRRGYTVFLDVEDLRSGAFNTALFGEIESCNDVVVVLTPGCLDRCRNEGDWLRLEVAHAIAHNKNVVPVMTRGFEWPPEPLPDDLAALPTYNGIAPSHEYFEASMDKLASLLVARPRGRPSRVLLLAGALGGLAALLVAGAAVLTFRGRFAHEAQPLPGAKLRKAPPEEKSPSTIKRTAGEPATPQGRSHAEAPSEKEATGVGPSAAPPVSARVGEAKAWPTPPRLAVQPEGDKPVVLFPHASSKIRRIAEEEGVAIDLRSLDRVDEPCRGILAQSFWSRAGTIEALRRFVAEGGRVVALVHWLETFRTEAEAVQGIFDIGLVERKGIIDIPNPADLASLRGKSISIEGAEYCALFDGLTLAACSMKSDAFEPGKPTPWTGVAINTHLAPIGEGWVAAHLVTNPEKCLSAWRRLGKGEILFLATYEPHRVPGAYFGTGTWTAFYEDAQIDGAQNAEAARRLIRWLAGKMEFPTPK